MAGLSSTGIQSAISLTYPQTSTKTSMVSGGDPVVTATEQEGRKTMDPLKDFSDTPTLSDPKAIEHMAYLQRAAFHIANWEADELTASWKQLASNYSDDFGSDVKTAEVERP